MTRAERVGEYPNRHAAPGRPDEGVLDLQAIGVRQPDVEAGVDVPLRGVDVGDHLVDGGI